MNDLPNLIPKLSVRHSHLIKNVCSPLNDCLGIPIFTHYSIGTDGHFIILSNYPEQLEYFWHKKLYLDHPYLRHPSMFRSGYAVTKPIYNLHYSDQCLKQFHIDEFFTILHKNAGGIEGFLFGNYAEENHQINFVNHIDLLNKFCNHFKRETKELSDKMSYENYNLKDLLGFTFMQGDPLQPLSSNNLKMAKFLKKISPLSLREQECVELYKQGHSAQSTATFLGISQRTVEHYFESIKNKLDYSSKRELLE